MTGGPVAGGSVADRSVPGVSAVGGEVWARPRGIVGLKDRATASPLS